MRERGMSFNDLADATVRVDPHGKGLRAAYCRSLARSDEFGAPASLQLVADALNVPVTVFSEYWAATVREMFNYRRRDPSEIRASLADLEAAMLDGGRQGTSGSPLRAKLEEIASRPQD
jgi:hypothetical protein